MLSGQGRVLRAIWRRAEAALANYFAKNEKKRAESVGAFLRFTEM
jgi:hypothetical protein